MDSLQSVAATADAVVFAGWVMLALGIWSIVGVALATRGIRGWSPMHVVSFFTGWLLSEAPLQHLMLWWLWAIGLGIYGAFETTAGLAGAGLLLLGSVGLAFHAYQATLVPAHADLALRGALGDDYAAGLSADFDREARFPPGRLWFSLALFDRRVRVIRDVSYMDGGGTRQRLDIYLPPGDVKKAPVFFQIHGGAWIIGHKAQQARPLLYMMARLGFVCVSTNYSLSPRHSWPAHIVDVKRALVWVKKNIAEYGGDPDRIVATGGSAGGHLTALVALTGNDPQFQPGFEEEDTRVQAAVPFYGVYDFLDRENQKPYKGFVPFIARVIVKKSIRQHREVFEQASPLNHVRADAPPLFVIHGANDGLACVEEARMFVDRLREVSTSPVAYLELPYTQHAFEVFYSLRTLHVLRAVHRFAALQV